MGVLNREEKEWQTALRRFSSVDGDACVHVCAIASCPRFGLHFDCEYLAELV
jgi:hypothetical protein